MYGRNQTANLSMALFADGELMMMFACTLGYINRTGEKAHTQMGERAHARSKTRVKRNADLCDQSLSTLANPLVNVMHGLKPREKNI